jgi:hypothetical protein
VIRIAGTSTRQLVTRYALPARGLLLWLAIGAALIPSFASNNEVSAHPASTVNPIYFGLMYPNSPDVNSLSAIGSQVGKQASLDLWYESWELNGQLQAFPTGQMEAIREHGSIPVLAWEPDNYPLGANQPQFSLASIINGAWDTFLRQYAAEVKAWGHPFFLRYASEMNANWVSWSEVNSGNSAGQFVTAWRHVHDIFTSVGATNVTWVWCPNIEKGAVTPIAELYPGNAYVDWAGIDGYNFGFFYQGATWQTFSDVFSPTYSDLLSIIPPGMPILVGETGTVESGALKPAWITDALSTQLPYNFPRIRAFIWFDSVDGNYNMRIDTSAQSLAAFQQAIASNTYESNYYSNLNEMPILPPGEVAAQPATPTPTATPLPPVSIPTTSDKTTPLISESYSAGPSPGTVRVINAQFDTPVPKAALVYQTGVTMETDPEGSAPMPQHLPKPVLTMVVVGIIVVHTKLALNPERGYQLQIDLQAGTVEHILVRLFSSPVNLLPLIIQAGLLVLMVAIMIGTGIRGLFRRRRRKVTGPPSGELPRFPPREEPIFVPR